MKRSLKSILALTLICLITTLLLATVNHITAPIIEETERKKEQDALKVVMPEGEGFTPIELSEKLPESIEKVYAEDSGKGLVFRMKVTGYSSGMTVLCGISSEGRVTGAVCLSSSETLGYEKTFGDLFKGTDADGISDIDTVSGATKTTEAYKKAVSDAFAAFETLGTSPKED